MPNAKSKAFPKKRVRRTKLIDPTELSYHGVLVDRLGRPTATERALAKALVEMIEVSRQPAWVRVSYPIARAVKAVRRVRPKYKFEDY